MRKSQGFTLIEIMIVVAIIGILAAIAVPMYQTYVIRARITEALQAANSAKTYIAIYHSETSQLPDNSAQVGLDENVDWDYVSKIEVGAAGRIIVTVRGSAMNLPDAETRTFEMIPTENSGSISWRCEPPGTVDQKYLPPVCRSL